MISHPDRYHFTGHHVYIRPDPLDIEPEWSAARYLVRDVELRNVLGWIHSPRRDGNWTFRPREGAEYSMGYMAEIVDFLGMLQEAAD